MNGTKNGSRQTLLESISVRLWNDKCVLTIRKKKSFPTDVELINNKGQVGCVKLNEKDKFANTLWKKLDNLQSEKSLFHSQGKTQNNAFPSAIAVRPIRGQSSAGN